MQTTDSSVSSLIITFTRSLDYFKNLREQRKKRKSSKVARTAAKDALRGDELKLSMSLRQGPVEIQKEYERNYRAVGDRYAIGDPIASASLARAIRRLNAGLLSIISSFLSCGRKDTQLDYKYLTSVSELSRQEALEALSGLSARMSRSALSLNQQQTRSCNNHTQKAFCTRDCKKRLRGTESKTSLKERPKQPKSGRDEKKEKRPEVRRVQLSSSSEAKLAIVRPRARRNGSSSSSITSSKQAATPPPAYSPPASPGFSTHPPTSPGTPGFSHHPYSPDSIARALQSRGPRASVASPEYTRSPLSPPQSPGFIPMPVPTTTPQSPVYPPSPLRSPFPTHSTPYPDTMPSPQRRRQNKLTPSMHTFASDSTKLGEIPMRRWNVPFDYDDMERRNEEMKERPWTANYEPQKVKRGWFGFFKKGGREGVVVG